MDGVGNTWFMFSMITAVVTQFLIGLPFLFMAPCVCCLVPAMCTVLTVLSDVDKVDNGPETQMEAMFGSMLNMTRGGKAIKFNVTTQSGLVTLQEETGEVKVEGEGGEPVEDVEAPAE